MKAKMTLKIVVFGLITLLFALSFLSCSKTTEPDDDNGVPAVTTGNVTGKISAGDGGNLEGATITLGNFKTTTNAGGEFLISGVSPGQDIVVAVEKDDHIPTYRSITVTAGRTTHITATVFTAQIAWNINPSIANKIEFSMSHEGHIDLPENAFVDSNGNPFNGTVKATARYFDPTDQAQIESFPGTFSGIQTDGTEIPFESYGFISATFTAADQRGEKLQLADGKKAELKVPVPDALAANAPESMPLWYFDEEQGKWIEDGIGIKEGNYYVGEVTHFSYWNFDYPITPENQSTLTGKVLMTDADDNDVPANGAEVVAMGVDFSGYTVARTNSLGEYTIIVKASAQVRLRASIGANASAATSPLSTPSTDQNKEVDDLIIGDRRFRVTGVLKNTSGEPLANAQLMMKEYEPSAGEFPFSVFLGTDEEGRFDRNAVFGTPGESIRLIVTSISHGKRNDRDSYFSNPIAILAPYPGDTFDFGDIICYPGGTVSGKAVDSAGNPLADTGITFIPEEAESEENFFWVNTDENGNFKLTGAPNSTIKDMVGSIWTDDYAYQTNPFDIKFPASGQTRNIGNVVFIQNQD